MVVRHFPNNLSDMVFFNPVVELTVSHVNLELPAGVESSHFLDHMTQIFVALFFLIELILDGYVFKVSGIGLILQSSESWRFTHAKSCGLLSALCFRASR